MIVIKVPVVRRVGGGQRTEQVKRSGALKRNHAQTVLDGLNVHAPVSGAGAGMEVTIIDKNLERQTEGVAGANKFVSNVSGVGALLHPDSLFEERVSAGKCPHRRGAFQVKALDEFVALRVNGATHPAVGAQ